MPLGVTMTQAEIMDWVPGSHASTFGGNPVAIAAALATLDVHRAAKHLLENSASVGNHILKRMADWPKKLKLVGDVRGRGLMIGVDIVKDKKSRRSTAMRERDRIVELAFERGVLFLGCGPSSVRIVSAAGRHKRRSRHRHGCAGRVHRCSWQRRVSRIARTHHGGTEPRRKIID